MAETAAAPRPPAVPASKEEILATTLVYVKKNDDKSKATEVRIEVSTPPGAAKGSGGLYTAVFVKSNANLLTSEWFLMCANKSAEDKPQTVFCTDSQENYWVWNPNLPVATAAPEQTGEVAG